MFGNKKFGGSVEYLIVGLGNPDRKYDILAKSVDGLRAIAIGDAVFTSIKEGGIKDLTGFIK